MRQQPHSCPMPAARASLAAIICAAGCVATWSAHAAEPADPEKVRAVLKQQEISFTYQGFTSFYSCEGMRSKVKRLLLALGAAKDVEVEVRGSCDSGNSVVRNPLVVIQLTSPVAATPEVLAELEKMRPQRELAARVRGDRGVATDAGAQFDASWKPVSLSRGKLGIDPGDCELIDELRKKVLPKLGVRIVKNAVSCSPKQINRSQPRLEVEALMQPPPPDTASTAGDPATEEASAAPSDTSVPPAAPERPQP
jgi:hypothetical protein